GLRWPRQHDAAITPLRGLEVAKLGEGMDHLAQVRLGYVAGLGNPVDGDGFPGCSSVDQYTQRVVGVAGKAHGPQLRGMKGSAGWYHQAGHARPGRNMDLPAAIH